MKSSINQSYATQSRAAWGSGNKGNKMKNAFLTYTNVTDIPSESQSIDSTPIVDGGYGVVEYRSRWAKTVGNKMVLYREIADGMRRFGQFIVWTTEVNGKVTKSFHEAAFGLSYGEGI